MKRYLWLVLFSLLLNSCSTKPVKTPPVAAPVDAKKELSQIQMDVAVGNEKRAITRLRTLIAKHPQSDVADDGTMQLAKIYYSKNMYDPAYQAYISLVNGTVLSPNEAQALLGASRCLYKLGRLDEALSLSTRGLKIQGLSEGLRLDFHKHQFTLMTALNDRIDALRPLAYIYANDPKPDLRSNAMGHATDIVNRHLNQNELEKVVGNGDFAFIHAPACYRLALFRLQGKDFDGARSMFEQAAQAGHGTPIERQAQTYLAQIDSRRKVDPYAVGAVLPLTGKYASVAQKTLKGLQLGLGIYGGERTPFKLAVVDSEGTPEGARRGVERLVSEDSVIAIVGSLLSRTAPAVAAKSEELGVPSIALSQKSGLTDGNSYVFRNAVTSQMQVHELVHLAMDQLGYKRFAILYPNDSYGSEYANLFWDEVLNHGGSISGAQIYSPQETDFRGPIRRLVGTYYIEDRKAEYSARVKEWFGKQKSLKTRNTPPDDLLPPAVDFDAIFVPDSPKAVGQIAPMLAYQGISGVRLLGTNLWNSGELARRGQKNVENALFVDSNITNDAAFKTTHFYQEFKRVFGEEPGLFEAQGYEVGLLLRQLISDGQNTRIGLAQTLTGIHEYQGVSGPMSMNTQRELVRPLVPLMVKEGTIVNWTPALEDNETSRTKK
jgi:branched-chain amino acid transport system substrate-binding protein